MHAEIWKLRLLFRISKPFLLTRRCRNLGFLPQTCTCSYLLHCIKLHLSVRGDTMRSILALGLLSLLVGCAASGVKVSEQQAQSFKVGVSTYSDVVTALDNPTSTTVASNGTRTAAYSYASMRSQPQNFIPYIGPLVAGYDNQSSSVTFNFDQRGLLASTTSSQAGMGTGANLAAGSNAATRPYEGVR